MIREREYWSVMCNAHETYQAKDEEDAKRRYEQLKKNKAVKWATLLHTKQYDAGR